MEHSLEGKDVRMLLMEEHHSVHCSLAHSPDIFPLQTSKTHWVHMVRGGWELALSHSPATRAIPAVTLLSPQRTARGYLGDDLVSLEVSSQHY